MLTAVLGNKIILYYWIVHLLSCRAATQYHILGAEKLRFWSGERYFKKGTLELTSGSQVQEYPQLGQSTNKPALNNIGTSEDFLLFFFSYFFFVHMLH